MNEESGTPRRWRLLGSGAIREVLFERGVCWAGDRSGAVNLVAALKGCADAISMRREVAAMMSDAEIATAQREARAWMTAH